MQQQHFNLVELLCETYDTPFESHDYRFVLDGEERVLLFYGPRYQLDRLLNASGYFRCEYSERWHLLDEVDMEFVTNLVYSLNFINEFVGS